MTETVKFKRCTCDICKKVEDIVKGELSPLTELVLPIDYCDEYGGFDHIVDTTIEVCEDCLKDINSILSEHYSMKLICYGGIEIKKRGAE